MRRFESTKPSQLIILIKDLCLTQGNKKAAQIEYICAAIYGVFELWHQAVSAADVT